MSDVPEMFANHPFSDNSADPTSMRSQGRPGLDHHLQRELNRIQDPLRSLENEPITTHNDQLPQTGNNQSSTKTALLGLVTTAWTAAVSLFVLKCKSK
ncbi:LPXTG cell wall anchor domain-containing protein [Limosilactobacillus panis]|uniref:LPXTG cell wall anchor domain-containing protein n=1 Tax=Limosilactobacillus panis TaxID=47493 RepID=UPI00064B5CB9|nr:LPXTG cell wall anchor domain-containing protein [Limosilactobacillus panis]